MAIATQPTVSDALPVPRINPNIPVRVLCVAFSDRAGVGRTCSDWISSLNARGSVWFSDNTFGSTGFTFQAADFHPGGAPGPNGWLPLARSSNGVTLGNVESQVLIPLDARVDYSNTDTLLIITNSVSSFGQAWPADFPRGLPPGTSAVLAAGDFAVAEHEQEVPDSSSPPTFRRRIAIAIVAEGPEFATSTPDESRMDLVTGLFQAEAVVLHEFGHLLLMPDRYGPFVPSTTLNRQPLEWYSLMGLQHEGWLQPAWAAQERRYLGYNRIDHVELSVLPGQSFVRNLVPAYVPPGSSGTHAFVVPVASTQNGSSFRGYVVEARRSMPNVGTRPAVALDRPFEQGVLVTWVDETLFAVGARLMAVADPNHGPGQAGGYAPLEVGDSIVDTQRGITITVLSENTAPLEGYQVRVERTATGTGFADPGMLPPDYVTVDSPDFWVDNPLNGFDVYRWVDAGGLPTLNGDPITPGLQHRFCARVRNFGTVAASQVVVELRQGSLGVGPLQNASLVSPAGLVANLAANSASIVCWNFTPTTDSMSVELTISAGGDDAPGNNVVRDNLWNPVSLRTGNSFESVGAVVRVSNPLSEELRTVTLTRRESERPSWSSWLSTRGFPLEKNGTTSVDWTINPKGHPDLPATGNERGQSSRWVIEAHGDTHGSGSGHIGSIAARISLSDATQTSLTVVDRTSSGAILRACSSPPASGRRLGLTARVGSLSVTPVSGVSDSSGCFQAFVPGPQGTWVARAGFVGTDEWAPSVSSASTFSVP